VLVNSPIIKMLNLLLQTSAMVDANAKLKVKQHPLEKFSDVVFNPNSGPQLQRLLYEQMGLPVLDLTDTKQPATGGDTIKKLINHTQDASYKELLLALVAYSGVSKILSTFIPAFERGMTKDDGRKYLHGNFNLGGTVSGRLSSSDPNMQNLPAGSDFGKLIKTCFQAPAGFLMVGADFSSLEDYISALTTKDPNKLAVYERGFDGHCLRAAYYFRDQCPEIDLNDPVSVNTIKKTYPHLRQGTYLPTYLWRYLPRDDEQSGLGTRQSQGH
jgi:DNA polymerase-1